MQHVSKVSFFNSADFFTHFARATNFPFREKKYYFTHLLHNFFLQLIFYNLIIKTFIYYTGLLINVSNIVGVCEPLLRRVATPNTC
jgi:hypothetical protein